MTTNLIKAEKPRTCIKVIKEFGIETIYVKVVSVKDNTLISHKRRRIAYEFN